MLSKYIRKYIRNKNAVSLIEVIVAATLIAIVFTGFVNLYYYGANLRANSQKRLQAVLAAQTFLEETRAARGDMEDSWRNKDELSQWLVNEKFFAEISENAFESGNMSVTLEDTELEHFINVKVKVIYQDGINKGGQKTIELETGFRELVQD